MLVVALATTLILSSCGILVYSGQPSSVAKIALSESGVVSIKRTKSVVSLMCDPCFF